MPGLCQRDESTLAACSVMPSVTLPCHMPVFQSAFRLPRCGDQRLDAIELRWSASDFLDRIALWMSPLRKHQQYYFGVLAPHSPWRALVASQAGRKLASGSKAPSQRRCAELPAPRGPERECATCGAFASAHLRGVCAQVQLV